MFIKRGLNEGRLVVLWGTLSKTKTQWQQKREIKSYSGKTHPNSATKISDQIGRVSKMAKSVTQTAPVHSFGLVYPLPHSLQEINGYFCC